jgi:hypothetical protein
MGRKRKRFAPARADLFGRGLTRIKLAAGDDEIGAVIGKRHRHLQAQPTASAGDQGGLARKIKQARHYQRMVVAK